MTEVRASSRAGGSRTQLGAFLIGPTEAVFRIWSPGHHRVEVEVDGAIHRLSELSDGIFTTTVATQAGARYHYFLDHEGPFPDPCSHWQPDGVMGSSQLMDMSDLARLDTSWTPPSLDELVIYELHVGTFSDRGTFSAIAERLPDLRRLGVRALELMPVATFPGDRGWGYDGLYIWSPHPVYGSPRELAELIDAAHAADLAIIIDVVYNHLGPGSEHLTAFGPYMASHSATLWGDTLDYSQLGVREWAIQNAEMWIRDYGCDGLRIDAAHAVADDSTPHVLAELATRVHSLNPRALVISEMEVGDLRPLQVWGHDAQWNDELHHAVHVLLTGEHDGYYKEYGKVADLALALERPEHSQFVVCAQNHDQVGNRAFGDRQHGSKLRLAAFCALLSPGTPMLFMGEEYDEQHPFQFFTDHIDPKIAEATRQGRRKEFASFSSFSHRDIPDPQSESTFLASKLAPELGDQETLGYYAYLLQLREQLRGATVTTVVDEKRRLLHVSRGEIKLTMNFSDAEVDGIAPWSGVIGS
jgi:maltooligosyltrehalose trehalohydrolase